MAKRAVVEHVPERARVNKQEWQLWNVVVTTSILKHIADSHAAACNGARGLDYFAVARLELDHLVIFVAKRVVGRMRQCQPSRHSLSWAPGGWGTTFVSSRQTLMAKFAGGVKTTTNRAGADGVVLGA